MSLVCSRVWGNIIIKVVIGDLTKAAVDAIVNPANSLMVMGGGVALAIKKAGGRIIEDEAKRHVPVPVGNAVATTAGRLKAKHVIHAPTMERPAMRIGAMNVYKATLAALKKALDLGVGSIAFPGMGTGVGGVPYEVAANTMIKAIRDHVERYGKPREIYLYALDPRLADEFCKAVKQL